ADVSAGHSALLEETNPNPLIGWGLVPPAAAEVPLPGTSPAAAGAPGRRLLVDAFKQRRIWDVADAGDVEKVSVSVSRLQESYQEDPEGDIYAEDVACAMPAMEKRIDPDAEIRRILDGKIAEAPWSSCITSATLAAIRKANDDWLPWDYGYAFTYQSGARKKDAGVNVLNAIAASMVLEFGNSHANMIAPRFARLLELTDKAGRSFPQVRSS
ncbi:hypothetical protein DYB37_014030, partial [Aphanomyces astaci]